MDVSQLQILVADYEILVKELTEELKSVKKEHEELKSKVPSIVQENQKLIEDMKEYVTLKKSNDSQTELTLVQNLQSQIDSILNEKEQITQLWQKAVKSVETLENELSIYKSGNAEHFPKQEYLKIKKTYEDAIEKLENQIKILKNESEVKNMEIQNLLRTSVTNTEAVKKSETKVNNLHKIISDLENSEETIKNKYKEKEKLIKKLMDQNNEFRDKVIEAIEIVQAALNEKDAALMREAKMREEMQNMNQEFDNMIKDLHEKCKNDIDTVKTQAECKYQETLKTLKHLEEDLKEKTIQNEKLQAKNIILQNDIDKFSSGCMNNDESTTSKLLILEKNLETTFQKLLVSEKLNIQLKSEVETMKNDNEQMVAYYERALKAKDLEKLSLQNINNQHQSIIKENELKLQSLHNELQVKASQYEILEKDYQKHIESQEQLIAALKLEKSELTAAFNEKIQQLTNEIDTKDKVHKKVLTETKDIVTKLENFTKTLKTDTNKVKKENKSMKEELDLYKRKLNQYREVLNVLVKDVNKINVLHGDNQQNPPNILS